MPVRDCDPALRTTLQHAETVSHAAMTGARRRYPKRERPSADPSASAQWLRLQWFASVQPLCSSHSQCFLATDIGRSPGGTTTRLSRHRVEPGSTPLHAAAGAGTQTASSSKCWSDACSLTAKCCRPPILRMSIPRPSIRSTSLRRNPCSSLGLASRTNRPNRQLALSGRSRARPPDAPGTARGLPSRPAPDPCASAGRHSQAVESR
jgi:hypothetical protein